MVVKITTSVNGHWSPWYSGPVMEWSIVNDSGDSLQLPLQP